MGPSSYSGTGIIVIRVLVKVRGDDSGFMGWGCRGVPVTPNNLQFYGLYLLFKGYLLLNCRLLGPQVDPKP